MCLAGGGLERLHGGAAYPRVPPSIADLAAVRVGRPGRSSGSVVGSVVAAADPDTRLTRTKSHASRSPEGCGSSSGSERDKLPHAVRVLGVWELVRVKGTRDQNASALAGA